MESRAVQTVGAPRPLKEEDLPRSQQQMPLPLLTAWPLAMLILLAGTQESFLSQHHLDEATVSHAQR